MVCVDVFVQVCARLKESACIYIYMYRKRQIAARKAELEARRLAEERERGMCVLVCVYVFVQGDACVRLLRSKATNCRAQGQAREIAVERERGMCVCLC